MDRNQNKYRNDSIRIKNWDYGSPGYYYVTICTRNHEHYFDEVIMWDGRIDTHDDIMGIPPWDGMCGGIAGTHHHASLPPAAHPTHGTGPTSTHQPCAVVRLTAIGQIARQNWIDIPAHFPFVYLDEFVIMPDHIHGILCFQKAGYREHNANKFGPQSKNPASVIRNYKSATKSYATSHEINFSWQTRYHDDVITSGKELDNIRKYIRNNPAKWIEQGKNEQHTI